MPYVTNWKPANTVCCTITVLQASGKIPENQSGEKYGQPGSGVQLALLH